MCTLTQLSSSSDTHLSLVKLNKTANKIMQILSFKLPTYNLSQSGSTSVTHNDRLMQCSDATLCTSQPAEVTYKRMIVYISRRYKQATWQYLKPPLHFLQFCKYHCFIVYKKPILNLLKKLTSFMKSFINVVH